MREQAQRSTSIPFPRIKGHKAFDITQDWFVETMAELGQEVTGR